MGVSHGLVMLCVLMVMRTRIDSDHGTKQALWYTDDVNVLIDHV